MKEKLQQAIQKVLKELSLPERDFVVEHPSELSHGDYTTNVAMIIGNVSKENPRECAENIVSFLKEQSIDGVEDISIAGPGFINFSLTGEYLKEVVQRAEKEEWGKNDARKGERVMVEHTQPNPFKPFHIGHLMSNTIGESLVRLTEYAGADVARANYQGDVGPHVAKALFGLKEKGVTADDEITAEILGEAYVLGNARYEEDPSAKEAIDAINKEIYEETYEEMELYKKGREVSLAHFEELYALLGSRFDHYFFEGDVWEDGKERVEKGLKGGVFEESDGAIVYKGEKDGFHTRVFVTQKGTPTYEAKEIGLAFKKKETWLFDENVTVTAVEQKEYFNVVCAALVHLDHDLAEKYMHIHHGMMQLDSGKMSSRKGNIVTGESLLTTMREKALEKVSERPLKEEQKKEIADQAAVAAVKYMVLKQSMGKNITFDPERALSFEGDSGPYLQYTHARIASILKKAEKEGVEASLERAPKELPDVARLLERFPHVVLRAQSEYEPHYVTTYLTELASAFNSWYGNEVIVDASDEYSPYKTALAGAVGNTLKNGLYLLGIEAPEEM